MCSGAQAQELYVALSHYIPGTRGGGGVLLEDEMKVGENLRTCRITKFANGELVLKRSVWAPKLLSFPLLSALTDCVLHFQAALQAPRLAWGCQDFE